MIDGAEQGQTQAGIKNEQTPIVLFYSDPSGKDGSSLDPEGRSLEDIWRFTNAELECNHDYIQIIFPVGVQACRGYGGNLWLIASS